MAKKRKRLPEDFLKIVKSGDFERFQEIFESCEIDARVRDIWKYPAIYYAELSDEMFLWLLDHGADVNCHDHTNYDQMPLHEAARGRDVKQLLRLLEHGAEVDGKDRTGCTPLHFAADSTCCRLQKVKVLLDHGADVHVVGGYFHTTPLEYMLGRLSSVYEEIADTAELLLAHGAEITPQCLTEIRRIGEDVEFRRADFSPAGERSVDAGLSRLYRLFGVEPVPRRRIHDGKSPIVVQATAWQKQYQELWKLLVPGSGPAATLQGEAIRLSGKVGYEILDNGGANWCADFRKMLKALGEYTRQGKALAGDEEREMARLTASLSPDSDEAEVERLSELTVRWILGNPDPIEFDPKSVSYNR